VDIFDHVTSLARESFSWCQRTGEATSYRYEVASRNPLWVTTVNRAFRRSVGGTAL